MKKTNLILGIGTVVTLGGALVGILRHKNKKEKMICFSEDDDLKEEERTNAEDEEKEMLEESKEDVDRNRDEITSLWEHIEALYKKDSIKKDRG